MPNSIPHVLDELTYDDYDLQASDLRVEFDIVRGLNDGLAVRGEDTVVPGRVGQVPRNRMADHREIELRGRIMGTGSTAADQLEDWQASMDALDFVFRPDRDPAALEGIARDGSTRSILARPLPGGIVVGPEEAPGTRPISVVLISVVPDWTVPS